MDVSDQSYTGQSLSLIVTPLCSNFSNFSLILDRITDRRFRTNSLLTDGLRILEGVTIKDREWPVHKNIKKFFKYDRCFFREWKISENPHDVSLPKCLRKKSEFSNSETLIAIGVFSLKSDSIIIFYKNCNILVHFLDFFHFAWKRNFLTFSRIPTYTDGYQ